MNAVVYARYSSHKQGEQSIEGQLAAAYKYTAEHGYTIIHEYCDRAQTGRNDDREQFQQMLKDTAKHQFEAVIIWKIDRFGRNREEIAFNKYRCKKNGVKVLYTAESIPDTPEGIILEAVLEGMAEYYSVRLATNVKRGMDNVARKGQSVGGTIPLGYRTGADKHLEPDPRTAPLVKQIFEMYAAGSTQKEIIDFISEKTYRYYIEQNTDTSYTDSLHAELDQVKAATANLIRAVEAGIFNSATKARMDELEQQQKELEIALTDAELVSGLRLTQAHIKFFLLQFRQLNLDKPESQRRVIDIFVNAIFRVRRQSDNYLQLFRRQPDNYAARDGRSR